MYHDGEWVRELKVTNERLTTRNRDLETQLDDITAKLRRSNALVYNQIIKPKLELEELISSYNDGMFEDSRQDRAITLKYYSDKFPELHEKYKDEL